MEVSDGSTEEEGFSFFYLDFFKNKGFAAVFVQICDEDSVLAKIASFCAFV